MRPLGACICPRSILGREAGRSSSALRASGARAGMTRTPSYPLRSSPRITCTSLPSRAAGSGLAGRPCGTRSGMFDGLAATSTRAASRPPELTR